MSANDATQAANNEKLTAESRLVAAEAYQNVAQNPELSAGLAMQAIGLQDSPQAENALRAALPGVQEIHAFQDGAGVSSVAVDPKNPDEVASADFNGHARIWDIRTGQHPVSMSLGGFQATGTANTVAFNEAGTEVAVGYGGGDIAVFDAHTGKNLRWRRTAAPESCASSSSGTQTRSRSRHSRTPHCGCPRRGRSAATSL